ncbi:MFS transporter [Rhodopila sp.]|uniref:MFS transporter n=1 Tax=Rhodopila sp. TaxID=2480087 RepID=UPI002C899076|nr:MFS transporter [Rhodopila sp.]HVZ08414.1 MFS transporter [Rhodopila sp.]
MRREIDSPYAWVRLAASVGLAALGGGGMWSVVVVLPAVQADFGVDRAAATLPYTLTTIGFGVGGMIMGRLADKVGIIIPLVIGALALGLGNLLASQATTLWQFGIVYGVLIGLLGAGSTFAPLMADISHWFEQRRGIAVALCASGNYVAGACWPPFIEFMVRAHGWRTAHLAAAAICVCGMLPLVLVLRARSLQRRAGTAPPPMANRRVDLGPRALQLLLAVAGLACCVAMSMPQVHIVAYCGDLGYGAQAGAFMLSLMTGFGIISRIGSGFLADRLGGLATLVIGSAAQGTALALYLMFSSLPSLYVVSALFGLFQGGLVPSYAIIIRENFPANQAGGRVGLVMMMTLLGMALGGWMSGVIFDATGSYRAAFANGVAWNIGNLVIALFLLSRARRVGAPVGRTEGQAA